MSWWKPYVPVARRRTNALRKISKLQSQGHPVSPVRIDGRQIAHTFWGKAWCENLERYSDFENRLPRGRSYVRNGAVIDLQIAPGKVEALVSGSEVYTVTVTVPRVASRQWVSICDDCGSSIRSVVELLQGRLSDGVMERICRPKTGLFPEPSQIDFRCTCPDWAWMCKHVAAVLYGIGARLDKQPELLFKLRDVDASELVAGVDGSIALGNRAPMNRRLQNADLSELFNLDLTVAPQEPAASNRPVASSRTKTGHVTTGKPAQGRTRPGKKKPSTRRQQSRRKNKMTPRRR